MTRAEKISHNRAEKRIANAYRATCSNVEVMVLDIPKIYAEGHRAVKEGADDLVLAQRIKTFVDTIRQN